VTKYPTNPNPNVWAARRRLGLSRRALAERVGTTERVIEIWELYSLEPKDPEVRKRAYSLLGMLDEDEGIGTTY